MRSFAVCVRDALRAAHSAEVTEPLVSHFAISAVISCTADGPKVVNRAMISDTGILFLGCGFDVLNQASEGGGLDD